MNPFLCMNKLKVWTMISLFLSLSVCMSVSISVSSNIDTQEEHIAAYTFNENEFGVVWRLRTAWKWKKNKTWNKTNKSHIDRRLQESKPVFINRINCGGHSLIKTSTRNVFTAPRCMHNWIINPIAWIFFFVIKILVC